MKKTILEEEINSVTLKKGAKGDYTWEIKVYGDDMTTIDEKIKRTDDIMRKLYGDKKGGEL